MTLEEKLVAKGDFEKQLKKYVVANASDVLTEKILADDYQKNIRDAGNFIKNEAQKKAKDGCAILTDPEVYGMLMHYLEEDSIKVFGGEIIANVSATKNNNDGEESKPKKKANPKPQKQSKVEERQESLFDFM